MRKEREKLLVLVKLTREREKRPVLCDGDEVSDKISRGGSSVCSIVPERSEVFLFLVVAGIRKVEAFHKTNKFNQIVSVESLPSLRMLFLAPYPGTLMKPLGRNVRLNHYLFPCTKYSPIKIDQSPYPCVPSRYRSNFGNRGVRSIVISQTQIRWSRGSGIKKRFFFIPLPPSWCQQLRSPNYVAFFLSCCPKTVWILKKKKPLSMASGSRTVGADRNGVEQ